jgi:REP element-mobilizing transposase RayT
MRSASYHLSIRAVYFSMLRENIDLYGVSLMGYCLMSNHVHVVVVALVERSQPLREESGR